MPPSCSGGGSGGSTGGGGSNPASPQSAKIPSQWTFTGTEQGGFEVVLFANLTPSGNNSFFAAANNVAACFTMNGQQPPVQAAHPANCSLNTVSLDGTLSGTDSVNIQLTGVQMPFQGPPGEDVTASGTFTAANSAVTGMQGNWNTTNGTNSDSGTWIGETNTSFTGTYSGTINFNGNIPVNVTLTLTQDNSHNITGSAALQGDACYLSWQLNGSVIGGAFGAYGFNKVIALGGIQLSPTSIVFGYKTIAGGCTSSGIGILNKTGSTQSVQASERQKELLQTMLDALQSRMKIA